MYGELQLPFSSACDGLRERLVQLQKLSLVKEKESGDWRRDFRKSMVIQTVVIQSSLVLLKPEV
jgi:hypothetical protein